ncbi:MAG: hypothetical protein KBB64_12405 [Bacteroidia bacterium]|nr:hypothetical protein [Bacteroidia bacterium]
METKNLLITFDYELFLGMRSGQPEDCMLQPTSALLAILGQYNTKAIFFVDTTYLCKLKSLAGKHEKCASDLKNISEQVLAMIDEGHYVMPHVHPHWLDAIYLEETGEFDLTNVDKYRFHNLTPEQRREVFGSSVQILQDIIWKKYPDYKIDSFRAGGWSIQPFSDFKPVFEEFGIKYDLSVVTGLYQFSSAQIYDFSAAPRKFIYRFNEDITVESKDGPFIQVAGSVIRIASIVDYLDRAHKKMLNVVGYDQDYAKGYGQASEEVDNQQPSSKDGYNVFDRTHEVASLEKISLVKLPVYEKFLGDNRYLHFISHPKMLSRHNFYILRQFLKNVTKKWKIESDFKIMVNTQINNKD